MNYEKTFKTYLGLIDEALKKALPPLNQPPVELHTAMYHAVFPGGKRFRPVLMLAAAEACGGAPEAAAQAAAAIELIHSYSLVHDDLPALDNDDVRRGNPSIHKRFGEAVAILTGDGLLTLGFELLSDVRPAKTAVDVLREISTAAGTYGMIGGQVEDLESGDEINLPMLDHINAQKTGKLIRASAICGAVIAGADKEMRHRILRYGEFVGLAFQSVDDMQDGDGYLRLMKPKQVREQVRDLIAKAKNEIRPLGASNAKLVQLADFLLDTMPKETASHVQMDSEN